MHEWACTGGSTLVLIQSDTCCSMHLACALWPAVIEFRATGGHSVASISSLYYLVKLIFIVIVPVVVVLLLLGSSQLVSSHATVLLLQNMHVFLGHAGTLFFIKYKPCTLINRGDICLVVLNGNMYSRCVSNLLKCSFAFESRLHVCAASGQLGGKCQQPTLAKS